MDIDNSVGKVWGRVGAEWREGKMGGMGDICNIINSKIMGGNIINFVVG